MKPSTKFTRASWLLAALFGIHALPMQASAIEATAIEQRFPDGSIQSAEQAAQALDAVASERKNLEQVYKSKTRACYKNFLVNQCLADEKKIHDAEAHRIDGVELRATRYQRQQKHEDIEQRRHAVEAERANNAEADAAKRAQNRATFAQRQSSATTANLKHDKNAAASKPHVPGARAVDNPQTRLSNASKQDKKEKEAEQHRTSLAAERISKVAERAKKLEAKQAKDSAAKQVAPASNGDAVQSSK